MSPLRALLLKDARVVYRDRFLLFLPVYAVALAVVARFGAPALPLEAFPVYLAPLVVLFGALLLGNVLGFALIEEREQGTWLLLRVLPVGEKVLFAYLGIATSLLGWCLSLVAALAYGQRVADPPGFLLMTAAASLTAPLAMLVLGALAHNKVEGLAVTKIFNLVTTVPAVVFVAPPEWQLLAAWCPWYWAYLGLLEAYAGSPAQLPAVHWPGWSLATSATATALLSLAAFLLLARAYTRRAG